MRPISSRHSLVAALCGLGMGMGMGCGGGGGGGGAPPSTLTEQVQALEGVAVFFGHNSVGANIVSGLGDVFAQVDGPKPTIAYTQTASAVNAGVFAHYGIGGNGYPDQKIATFRTLMTGPLGGKVDIAFMKFCFVDFQSGTWDTPANVDALMTQYQAMVTAIHDAHPGVKIVHVTVPLSPQDSIDNARRERISARLRSLYGSDVFDLARIESTDPSNGQRITGPNGPYLWPEWASDTAGHLNAGGSESIARALVTFLAGKV